MTMMILDLLTRKVVVRTRPSSSVYVDTIMCAKGLCEGHYVNVTGDVTYPNKWMFDSFLFF